MDKLKDLYDFWNNSEKNIFLTAPYGFGKSTHLKNFMKKVLESKNNIIPIYLSLNNTEVINNGIYNTILLDYCGEISSDYEDQLLCLKKVLKGECNPYEYIFLIDDYETLINNNIYEKSINEIKELSTFNDNISIIVSSTYFDEFNFQNFNHIKLMPLDYEKTIQYIKSQISISVDVFNDSLLKELCSPLSLKEFIGIANEKNILIEQIEGLSSGYDLFKTKLELLGKGYSKVIYNLLPSLANYCSENNTNTVPYCILEKAYSNYANLPIFESIKFAFKRRYGENKDDLFSYLNIFSENLNIGSIIQCDNNFEFRFSRQFYINYFTASYCQYLNNGALSSYLLNPQTISAAATFLDKKTDKLEKLLEEIRLVRKKRQKELDQLEAKKEAFLITNIVNLIYECKGSFEGVRLNNLDLRFCNFIGKNCEYVWFSNSILSDECFIAIEPENSNIFAVSSNGKYYITGDENRLNLRSADAPVSIKNFSSQTDNEYSNCYFIGDDIFCVQTKKEVLKFEIINESVQFKERFAHDGKKQFQNSIVKSDMLTYANLFGKICYANENYALVQAAENSYYGHAYLLFDLNNNDLISVHKIDKIIRPYRIVQDGNEIEFLYENSGDGILKSICYDEESCEIYKKKKVLHLLNRFANYPNGKILFDTNNINSYMQWFFEKISTNNLTEEYYREHHNEIIRISKMEHSFFRRDQDRVNIVTPKQINYLKYKGKHYIFQNDSLTTGLAKFVACQTITSRGTFMIDYITKIKFWLKNTKFYYNCAFGELKNNHISLVPNNINLIDISENEFELMICNDIYAVQFNKESNNFSTSFKEQLPLNFEPMYEKAIEEFPWYSTIERILSERNENDNLEYLCKKYVYENIKNILEKYKDSASRHWNFVFSCFIEIYINFYCYSNKNILPENFDFINAFKNWCFPCDNGVIYFDGCHTCYLSKSDSGTLNEVRFTRSCWLLSFRDNIHIYCEENNDYIGYYYKLYDINKSDYENSDSPEIRFNNLWLYKAAFDEVKGLSQKVKDFLIEESKK